MILLLALSCLRLPSLEGVSVPATPIPWPPEVRCLNQGVPGVAKEVLVGASLTVVVAGGARAISDADWPSFDPGLTNLKNDDRALQFSESCFWRSPSAPATCEGDACRTIVEIKGHTWVELAQVVGMGCLPDDAEGCGREGVPPGALSVSVIKKCQSLTFTGAAWFLTGPEGQRAVMHATETGAPRGDARLPPGWTLRQEALAEPLVLYPYGVEGDCSYTILRDELVQSYHLLGGLGAASL